MRQYFGDASDLEEAAYVDGSGVFHFLYHNVTLCNSCYGNCISVFICLAVERLLPDLNLYSELY